MPKIITLANQKGGVGKSTLAVNLAHAFKNFVPTAIVDMDSQGSISNSRQKTGLPVLEYNGEFDKQYGFIFIDTPPYLREDLQELFNRSDLVLIPSKAGVYDVLACRNTVRLIEEARSRNKRLKAGIILNMINPSTTLTEEAETALSGYGIPILKTKVGERMSFVRSAVLPDGIYSTNDNKAINEIDQLTKEVLFLLQN